MAEDKRQVEFKNNILPTFKNVSADGAYIGITPRGYLSINFYITKGALPTSVIHDIDTSGKVGKPIDIEEEFKFEGVIERQFEVGVILDIQAAKDFIKLMSKHIEVFENKINPIKPL
jgi:hypothetical protein